MIYRDTTKSGICIDCGEPFEKTFRSPNPSLSPRCDTCKSVNKKKVAKEYRIKNKALAAVQMKEWRLLNIHGITQEDVLKILSDQNFQCLICSIDITENYAIDHDHACCPVPSGGNGSVPRCGKCFRGLLCKSCNSGLGFFKDNPELLMNAIYYLKEA